MTEEEKTDSEKAGVGDDVRKEQLDDGAAEIEFISGPASEPEEKKGKAAPKEEPEETKSLKSRLRKREGEVKALKKEKEEWKDKYLRKLAEFENTRKRYEREKNEYYLFALTDILEELLIVLDNFERALVSRNQADGKSFQEGVELIHKQYLDLLRKKGVTTIEVKDRKFDPAHHQAVLTEESEEVEEPEVAEELQKGYLLHERLLRPTLVKVRIPKRG